MGLDGFSPDTKLTGNQKKIIMNGGGRERKERTRTLISLIDAVSVETCGAMPLKCARAISMAGKLGREMVTRSERISAQKRTITPGMKKLWAIMTVANVG
jgi:hypothetical protein